MTPITATLWLTAGITGYGGDFVGQGMACGFVYTSTTPPWAAVPIEWMASGAVECGDLVHLDVNGQQVVVPVGDTGCMLHWGTWDTGEPLAVDLPRLLFPAEDWPTMTGQVAVWRVREGTWWTPPSLTAWATEYCQGPLTWDGEWRIDPC